MNNDLEVATEEFRKKYELLTHGVTIIEIYSWDEWKKFFNEWKISNLKKK